jgi:methylenetetrahydrofolate dehydrogenase (NADP+)/methenyltetrahydrofolate cyclohydrolase
MTTETAKIIDGAAHARQLTQWIANRVRAIRAEGRPVHLASVLVAGNSGAEMYAQRQSASCRAVGIDHTVFELPATATTEVVRDAIHRLNDDPAVSGIMMHVPLPPQIDRAALQKEIEVLKDIEGVHPANAGCVVNGDTLLAPCTAAAVINLIELTGVTLRGAEAVVVGASEIVGKPIALLLIQRLATVTTCHLATRDLAAHTGRAEILVVAAGRPKLITADHVREGAVVIDVGINRVRQSDGNWSIVGDVDFDAVKLKAAHITPVPGGVGPMTVATLLKNTLRSAELINNTSARV